MINLIGSIFTKLTSIPDTRKYPAEKRAPFAGTRGHIDIDIEKCNFCGACQKRCPANALDVKRAPQSWTINPYACIVCNYCVEICPRKCIVMREHCFTSSL